MNRRPRVMNHVAGTFQSRRRAREGSIGLDGEVGKPAYVVTAWDSHIARALLGRTDLKLRPYMGIASLG